tara:strand:- start:15 stop:788 length:774 start_codon:yes stop_codon:yes gene_type:complete
MALTKVIGAGLGATQEGAITFNEGSADADFRVESNGQTHMLFVDGGNNSVGLGSSTPDSGRKLHIEGNDTTVGITLKDTAGGQFGINSDGGSLTIKSDSTATVYMTMDSTGAVTLPKQPAFAAIGSSTPTLAINTTYVLPVDTERFDQNADFNTSNYTFTAPVTGRYQLNGSIYMYNHLDASAGYMIFTIRTSNEEYQFPITSSMFGSDIANFGMNISALADMDASDTAVIDIFQQAGAAQVTISGGHTHFNGFLVC